jgi:hypothetical protein
MNNFNNNTPVIISASRATDIPAYYSKWLINRLHEGYCVYQHPYNKIAQKVSFEKARVFVFWTKNPEPLMPYLKEFDERNIGYYFQYTLNDYPANIENVPSLTKRIDTFKRLCDMIGPERIIWRYDPIMITPDINIEAHLERIQHIGDALKGMTEKLVFSFFDDYGKAKVNLIKADIFTAENIDMAIPSREQMIQISKSILSMCKVWGITPATCAEAVTALGIQRNKCIDGDLIDRLFSKNDPELNAYMSQFRMPSGNINPLLAKDRGQRRLCGCMVSKDIGAYNTCLHNCAYCYATNSYEEACANHKMHKPEGESLIPFKAI